MLKIKKIVFNFGKREENNEYIIMTIFLVNELKRSKTSSPACFCRTAKIPRKGREDDA